MKTFFFLNIIFGCLWFCTVIAKIVLGSVIASASLGTSQRVSEQELGICTVTKLLSSKMREGVTVS